jgi:predicted nucleic acid-binding protein
VALSDLSRILESPAVVLLHETDRHAEVMMQVVEESGASGNLVHDAHIAALCLEHGISELVTGDRDFARFKSLRVQNPFR